MTSRFVQPSITGFNSNPPPDDGSQTEENEITWAKHLDKLATPLRNYVDALNANVAAAFGKVFLHSTSQVTSTYTLQPGDIGKLLVATGGAYEIDLIAAATASDGFPFSVFNAGTGDKTIDPNASETVAGKATFPLKPGEAALFVCDGSNWQVVSHSKIPAYSGPESGTASAHVVTSSGIAATAYYEGMRVVYQAGNDSTGATTVDVDGLGAKTIKVNVSEDTAAGDILENSYIEIIYDGTNFQLISPNVLPDSGVSAGSYNFANITVNAKGLLTDAESGDLSQVLHIQDQKASGTDGQNMTAASWNTRDANTVVKNTISGASLASNKATLPAATYMVMASLPQNQSSGTRDQLYNDSDSSVILTGINVRADSAAEGNNGLIIGFFTLADEKDVLFRTYVQSGAANPNYSGTAITMGDPEVYLNALFWKVT